MNYSREQLDDIEKVKSVFCDYLKHSNEFELLWSDKWGYVLLSGITKEKDGFIMQPEIISTAERLYDILLFEIACEVIESVGEFHDISLSTSFERQLILEAYQPYMNQLPEYNHIVERLLDRSEQ